MRVQSLRYPRLCAQAAFLTLMASAFAYGASPAPVAVDVELRARALAPGEPVALWVHAPVPLKEVSARFLGQAVACLPVDEAARPGTCLGWAVIPLDQKPGEGVVEISGRSADGRAVAGTRAFRIEGKEFPVERLTVASKYVKPPPEVESRLARERARLRAVYALRTPPRIPREGFVRPVPGEPTSVFGTRRLFNGRPRSPHPGLDLRAAEGTPVRASGPGRVVLAQDLYYSGNTVILDHGAGLFTLYAHLERIDVQEGDEVEQGRILGLSGATGRVTGPHLHWGAKVGSRPFDPTALLNPSLFR